jgi:hypothetical protein
MGKRGRRRQSEPEAASETPDNGKAGGDPSEAAADQPAPAPEPSSAPEPASGPEPAAASEKPGQPPAADQRPLPDATGRGAWILLETYRWVVFYGYAPGPEDWDELPDFPSSAEIKELFGGWEQMWEHAGLYDSEYLWRLDETDKERKQLAEDQRESRRHASRLAEERRRHKDQVRELERQAENSRRKAAEDREAVIAERSRAERAEERAGGAERALRERQAETAAAGGDEPPPEWLAEHEATVEALRTAERNADMLGEHLDEAMAGLEERERELQGVRRALGQAGEEADEETQEEPEPLPEPRSVLEAVKVAAERCPHLVFAPKAFETAEDSPFQRPALVLEKLLRLDELAELYLQGEIGAKLATVAFEKGLNWRGGVAATTRERRPGDYSVTLDGRTFDLGPHVRIGSGQGAGNIARIYLHLHEGDDELPRAVIVGHVGRHLPDTTT